MDTGRRSGCRIGIPPNRAMPMRSKPASRIWRAMLPTPMKRARISSRCGSNYGSKAHSPWPPALKRSRRRQSPPVDASWSVVSPRSSIPRHPAIWRETSRTGQTSARPASHLCQMARPRRRIQQWLRAHPQTIGGPAQGHQRLSRHVGRRRRGRYPHRGRHGSP